MKRLFQGIKQILSPKPQTVHPNIIEELAKPALALPHYIPYPDEPSVFDMNPGQVSMVWVHWAKDKHRYPLDQAMTMAERHKRWLSLYQPAQKVNTALVPDILVSCVIRGQETLVLSLEWVLWYAAAYNVTVQEAHVEGVFLTTRQPQGAVK